MLLLRFTPLNLPHHLLPIIDTVSLWILILPVKAELLTIPLHPQLQRPDSWIKLVETSTVSNALQCLGCLMKVSCRIGNLTYEISTSRTPDKVGAHAKSSCHCNWCVLQTVKRNSILGFSKDKIKCKSTKWLSAIILWHNGHSWFRSNQMIQMEY